MALRIEDYALIGDTETAALVGNDGSIDWLCLPRFDSAASFCALLGGPENGRFRIAPRGGGTATRRRYREGTLVLETEFETDGGRVRITDCMPPRDDVPDVVRVVEGLGGSVPMQLELVARFDYGRLIPWTFGEDVVRMVAGPDALFLESGVPVQRTNHAVTADFTVTAGDRVGFRLGWHPSHLSPSKAIDPLEAVERTTDWWRRWTKRRQPIGDWDEAVGRSLITLKALTYAPTGGIVAAPTTSLPEWIGGVRNWDYRYCWLRDAAFTLSALVGAGYFEEAQAWRDWLLRAVAGDPSQLRIMYGVAGEHRLPELELPWLPGYEASAPVRIGNGAADQHQLDIYGELLDTYHLARTVLPREAVEANFASATELPPLMRTILDYVETGWREPDEGIWEVRGPRRHFTHSKAMAWVAMDRAVLASEVFGTEGPVDRWRALRDEIHREVCEKAYDADRQTFVQHYGAKTLDGSLLTLALTGFLPATDPRIQGTVAAIERELVHKGFVYRYAPDRAPEVDGLPIGEGAFLACTFWLVDNLVLMGRRKEAMTYFERVMAVRNDVGLLAEQYDPDAQRQLGNFPQAFSHVYLVHTARGLDAPSVEVGDRLSSRPSSASPPPSR